MLNSSEEPLLEHPAVRELLAQGARDGFVSYAQINDLLIDLELDESDVEALLELVEGRAIAVADHAPVVEPKAAKKSATKAKKPSENSDLDDILADLEAIEVSDDLESVERFIAELVPPEELAAPLLRKSMAPQAEPEELYGGEDLDDDTRPVEDALKLYLNRMGQIPRLDAVAERELARIARDGTPDEAREAKNNLVEANLRLVVHMAKTAGARTTLSITDLLQEGNLGLLDAVERYRPESNKTFGAYATWWVRRAMNRAITDHARTMRLSGELYSAIQKLQTAQRQLAQELGRSATRAEIAAATGLSIEQIEEAQRAAVKPLSLDTPIGGEDDTTELGETLQDEGMEAIERASDRKEVAQGLTALLEELSEREKIIVMMRFGLGDYSSAGPQAADDVAKRLNLTRERLHDLETHALRKLRKKAKGAGLDQLLGLNREIGEVWEDDVRENRRRPLKPRQFPG